MEPDFLENNFLSNERRYPLNEDRNQLGARVRDQREGGHIWDNFSSQTYKELSPVDELEFFNPFDEDAADQIQAERKECRPRLLSHAVTRQSCGVPRRFLHNNALGKFTGDPSVAGRMRRI